MIPHHWRRITLGLFVTFAIFFLIDAIPSFALPAIELFGSVRIAAAVQMAVVVFISVLGGTFAARVNFVVPAILFSIAAWAMLVNIVYVVRNMAAPENGTDVIVEFSIVLVASISSSILAALLGMRILKRKIEIASTAT